MCLGAFRFCPSSRLFWRVALESAGHALLGWSSTCMGDCQCSGAELQGPTRVSSFPRSAFFSFQILRSYRSTRFRLTRLAIWIWDISWYIISWWFRFFLVYSLVFNFVANPSDWHTDCKEAFPAAFPSRSPSFVLNKKKVQHGHSNLFIHTQMIGTVTV